MLTLLHSRAMPARRLARRLLRRAALVVVPMLAACGSDAAAPGVVDVDAGTYTLEAAGGQPLPAVLLELEFSDGPDATMRFVYRVSSASLTLLPDGKYEARAQLLQTVNGVTNPRPSPWVDHGFWVRDGATVAFESNLYESRRFQAAIVGGVLTTALDMLDEQPPVPVEMRFRR
jgi:hypothetical protein